MATPVRDGIAPRGTLGPPESRAPDGRRADGHRTTTSPASLDSQESPAEAGGAFFVYQSEFELRVTLALKHDTPTGPRNVVVTNPDGSSASCDHCLFITDEIIR